MGDLELEGSSAAGQGRSLGGPLAGAQATNGGSRGAVWRRVSWVGSRLAELARPALGTLRTAG